jgi:DNA-binding MarR family transcriptional regulator
MGTMNEPILDLVDEAGGLAEELLRRLDLLAGAGMHEDVSYSKYKTMAVIRTSGPIAVGALGKIIGSPQSTTSEMVARLAKAGLVEKSRNVYDGRAVFVELSLRGRQLVEQYRGRVHEGYRALFGRMSPPERDVFLRALERLDELLRKGTD